MSGIDFRMLSSRALAAAAVVGMALTFAPVMAQAQEEDVTPREKWSFAGMLGRFDRAQLQRGYQVYKEVCSNCHSLRLVKYRNLAEPGGPGFTEAQVKTLAAEAEFEDAFDDSGNPVKRKGLPSDAFKSPFPNVAAARAANNGAVPPDLSLMAKAREAALDIPFYLVWLKWGREVLNGYQEGGTDYIHALLTSFHEQAPAYVADAGGKLTEVPEDKAPKDALRCATVSAGEPGKPDICNKVGDGLYFNTAFPGHQLAMPPPLSDGQVTYSDGTPATVDQYARDVAAFLSWTADPNLEVRKEMGLRMMIYLIILAGILWLAKRSMWSRVKH